MLFKLVKLTLLSSVLKADTNNLGSIFLAPLFMRHKINVKFV